MNNCSNFCVKKVEFISRKRIYFNNKHENKYTLIQAIEFTSHILSLACSLSLSLCVSVKHTYAECL